jgi:Cu/Ag efflux pump CusA
VSTTSTSKEAAVVERLIRAALARPTLVVMLVLAGTGLGSVWLRDLPRDVFPDLSAPVST